MSSGFTLTPQMLTTAFPFHFVMDSQLKVVQAGSVLQRICSGDLIGSQLEDHFQIYRPKVICDANTIKKHSKSLFILNSLHSKMQMKGQIMYDEEQDLLFFLGSPWITDTENLAPLGIKLKDFAIHDPVVDFIFLLQASKTSLNETKKLTEELTQQQLNLRQALLIKENLANIAEAQAQRLKEALKDLKKTQAQLVQTEKMSGLGQMVAGVAHEINNPVNFIHANLDYVNDYTQSLLKLINLYEEKYPNQDPEIEQLIDEMDFDFVTEDLPQIINSMRIGTDRIREIVISLRNFSRLDEAEHKRVDIHEGIDSTLLILKHRLKETATRSAINIVQDYGDLPKIDCYAGQLNQVFMNLLGNAIDAFEEWDSQRSPEAQEADPCTISITTTLSSYNTITIKIADNGPGIPKKIQSELFNPFFTTKPVGKGTGLGLSISYQIVVEKHQGNLWCDSEPGRGAAFYIQLPLVIAQSNYDRNLIDFVQVAKTA